MESQKLWIMQVTTTIIIIILHSIGFYLLRNVKRGKFNVNNILITCLSGSEIAYGIISVLQHALLLQGNHSWLILFIIELFVIVPVLHSTILLITFNRYMACIHPAFYRKYATKKTLYITIVSMWVFSVALSVGVRSVFYNDVRILFWWMTTGISTVFMFILYAYTRIYLRLAKSSQRVSRHLPGQQNLKLPSILWNFIFHQGHITSLAIVVCYFLLIIIPGVVTSMLFHVSTHHFWSCFLWSPVMYNLNYIFDAIIYIYTDKDVKKLFLKKVNKMKQSLCSCRRLNNVDPVEGTFTPAVVLNNVDPVEGTCTPAVVVLNNVDPVEGTFTRAVVLNNVDPVDGTFTPDVVLNNVDPVEGTFTP